MNDPYSIRPIKEADIKVGAEFYALDQSWSEISDNVFMIIIVTEVLDRTSRVKAFRATDGVETQTYGLDGTFVKDEDAQPRTDRDAG